MHLRVKDDAVYTIITKSLFRKLEEPDTRTPQSMCLFEEIQILKRSLARPVVQVGLNDEDGITNQFFIIPRRHAPKHARNV
jgi:hypothetical protein